MKEKIKTKGELIKLAAQIKKRGKKIVLATGCFDILHSGHIQLFNKAKELGDILIVGANSDSSIKQIKGTERPIVEESLRLYNLSSLVPVDYVTSFPEFNPAKIISEIKPDVFVKGGDWRKKEVPETNILKSLGTKVVYIPIEIKTSTTQLASKIT